jgi:DNA mismatch repair protein MutS2
VFAQVEPRLQNATVAFDAERLEPTFRLEYGHPGPSHALTIGERLGLPTAVIARARVHLGEQGRRLESLLSTLETRTREAEAQAALAVRRETAAAEALAGAQRAAERARAEALGIRRAAEAEASALLADARRQVGQELERLKGDEARSRREAQEAYRRLRAAEAQLQPMPTTSDEAAPRGEVQLRGLGLRGRVVGEGDGLVTVQAGRLTVRVARSEIEPASSGAPRPPAPSVSLPVREDVPREIHLLGLTTDEARATVEKFLDDAALAGHREVRLVHGKGTGALRRAVEDCLRGHPLVGSFRLAESAAGGAGVTVVALDEPGATAGLARRRGTRPVPTRKASR